MKISESADSQSEFFPSRFPSPVFPRLQHHPWSEGAFPHVSDGGAAAAAGGAAGGRIHALHHHQTLRLLPVCHQRHHVTGGGAAVTSSNLFKECETEAMET